MHARACQCCCRKRLRWHHKRLRWHHNCQHGQNKWSYWHHKRHHTVGIVDCVSRINSSGARLNRGGAAEGGERGETCGGGGGEEEVVKGRLPRTPPLRHAKRRITHAKRHISHAKSCTEARRGT
eukprot:1902018-Rhodomonas_salina.1